MIRTRVFLPFLLFLFFDVTIAGVPVSSGEESQEAEKDTVTPSEAASRESFTSWSPCTATCAPAFRVRKKTNCNNAIEELCSEVKPCERKLPECGGGSFAADIHLLAGQSDNFPCPLHPHEPALRLVWYRWTNDSWGSFLGYDNTRVSFKAHTLHMAMTDAIGQDQGSYKCVLLYPDGKVKTARYYHLRVTYNYTILTEVLAATGVVTTIILLGLCVWGFCLPGSKAMLPCFKLDPAKRMSELYYSRLKEEGIIK